MNKGEEGTVYRFGFENRKNMKIDVLMIRWQEEISEAERVTAATEHAVAYSLRRNFAEKIIEEAENFGAPTTWMDLPNHEYVRLLKRRGYVYNTMMYEITKDGYKIWIN